MIVNYNNYNFDEDMKFKDFVKAQLPIKGVPYNRYHQFMVKCKRQYLNVLNSSHLRRLHNIPDDWEYQFMVED